MTFNEYMSFCRECYFMKTTSKHDVGCRSAAKCKEMGPEYVEERRTEGYAVFMRPQELGMECPQFKYKTNKKKSFQAIMNQSFTHLRD